MIVPDTDDKKGRKAVLFPAVLNRKKKVWVKAGLSDDTGDLELGQGQTSQTQERESVEKMLKKALQVVQSEEKASNKAEDKGGRVRITHNTVAVYMGDRAGAVKKSLYGTI